MGKLDPQPLLPLLNVPQLTAAASSVSHLALWSLILAPFKTSLQLLLVLSVFFPLNCDKKGKRKRSLCSTTCFTAWCLFSVGLLLSVHRSHVNLRKVTAKLRDHRSGDAGDPGCRSDVMEWGRLRGEVHLHRERPTSGGRVCKRQQDTSWEILTQKPGPKTGPQHSRGTHQADFPCLPVSQIV